MFRNLSRWGSLKFFFPEAQHPLGPENPLKSMNVSSRGGGLAPIAPLKMPGELRSPKENSKLGFPVKQYPAGVTRSNLGNAGFPS